MIVGYSLSGKRVYYVGQAPAAVAGELIELPDVPVALVYKTDVGGCSGPARLTARHCFGDPHQSVRGKTYTETKTGLTGAVIKDYSPPLRNIVNAISWALGSKKDGVLDVVEVNTPAYDSKDLIAVVSAGIMNQNIGFVASPYNLDVGTKFEALVDFPAEGVVRGEIKDYGVFLVWHRTGPWPLRLYMAELSKPFVPGNSGGPVYFRP